MKPRHLPISGIEALEGRLVTWRRLPVLPATDVVFSGGYGIDRPPLPGVPCSRSRMERRAGAFAAATPLQRPGGVSRGTWSPCGVPPHPGWRGRGSRKRIRPGLAAPSRRRPGRHWPRWSSPPRPSYLACKRTRSLASMYWNRRFAILVSLVWAMLVMGGFCLLAGISAPHPPETAAVPDPGWRCCR